MSSIIKVNTVQDTDGNNIINENANTITIGASGDTITIPSGATIDNQGTSSGFASIAWQSSIVTAATHTASAGQGLWLDTSSNGITLTLPASPSVGDQVIFTDYARNWGTNAVTLNLNSEKYQGNATPVPVYDTNGESVDIVYSGSTKGWIPNSDGAVALETPQSYSLEMLIIAGGGGGGGRYYAGGGGAGGYRTSTQSISPDSVAVTVTVGDGGSGSGNNTRGVNGSDSSISASGLTTITSTGGGGSGSDSSTKTGSDGGSGGGGSGYSSSAGDAGSGNTPSTTPSQGNDGGSNTQAGDYGGGGGGGAGGEGADTSDDNGANGGAGTASSITGSSVTRAGGGGGAGSNDGGAGGTAGVGGAGGGGNGGRENPSATAAVAGTANTGGGGGGGADGNGAAGGKGVVIISMPDANYSGTTTGSPTVATGVSGKTVLTFTGSGSYTT